MFQAIIFKAIVALVVSSLFCFVVWLLSLFGLCDTVSLKTFFLLAIIIYVAQTIYFYIKVYRGAHEMYDNYMEGQGMDFSMIPEEKRDRRIEKFLNNKCQDENGTYEKPMTNLAKAMKKAPKIHQPYYYSAAAYYFCYVKDDHAMACTCCESFLTLISCRHKDHLLSMYKWIANEPLFSTFNSVFDRHGNNTQYGKLMELDAIAYLRENQRPNN